ncbi:hypothetical protein C0995_014081 [Termitomyces sp. Mi166|nr:hypothetical protein C0995_014081 [Termitomyces sp. Mi166\
MTDSLAIDKENILPAATPASVSFEKGKQAKSGTKKSDAPPANCKPKHAVWTDKDNKILVNTLLAQHEEGVQTSNGAFKDPALQAAAEALKKSHLSSGGALKSWNHAKLIDLRESLMIIFNPVEERFSRCEETH